MKRLLQKLMAAAILVVGVAAFTLPAQPALAASCTGGKDCVTKGAGNVETGATRSLPESIQQVTNVLLFLLGAVAVIMLVIGGFKYVVSNGNAEQVKSAKNTIMYAIIGLVVAIVAYAAVDWVVKQL